MHLSHRVPIFGGNHPYIWWELPPEMVAISQAFLDLWVDCLSAASFKSKYSSVPVNDFYSNFYLLNRIIACAQ